MKIQDRINSRLGRLRKEVDLISANKINIDQLETLCINLGPQRNLSTLMAALMALHPDAQVLNHAGQRILKDARLNFLAKGDAATFRKFLKYALHISKSGKRGAFGGSILLAHSFDEKYEVRKKYQKRYGNIVIKDEVKLLFWKDSLRVGSHLRSKQIDLEKVFAENQYLKFTMPVRYPLDIMRSTIDKNYRRLYDQLNDNSSEEESLTAILDEMLWFCTLAKQFPNRFFYYFAHSFDRKTLTQLAGFLQLNLDEQWMKDCLVVFQYNQPYTHDPSIIDFYQQEIKRKFIRFPEFQKGLEGF